MEKKDFVKYLNSQIEAYIARFNLSQISIVYSKNILSIKQLGKIVGYIEFKYLTGGQLSVGALASIFTSVKIFGGEMWNEISNNELLVKKVVNPYTDYLFCFYSSFSKNRLFKNAKTDLLISDNIENRIVEFLNFIRDELIVKICNILLQNSVALEDILNTPSYYGQPEISLLLLCKNNHDEGLLSAIEQDKRFINSSNIDKKIWKINKTIIWGKL